MEKKVDIWSVEDLKTWYPQIDFPEYQREPNLWSLTEKQRLIDSMVRSFDIAPLYLYKDKFDSIDCVDGRQRIGTIMSFLGFNESDGDVNFRFKILNEIYDEKTPYFEPLDGRRFKEINDLWSKDNDPVAQQFLESFLKYKLNIVMLSNSNQAEEFNLQFTRLNLGAIINSGEKLHAMVGDLRDECFNGLGKHSFLQETSIPTKRFAREQVAAQILAQVFSLIESSKLNGPRTFARTRHTDLQRQFKLKNKFDDDQRETVARVSILFDLLSTAFQEKNVLRNRAITVSTVLLAWSQGVKNPQEAETLASFVDEFVHRLRWQVRKGLFADQEYHYLTDFQRSITQASAESSSVEARAQTLEEEFARWLDDGKLRGDTELKERKDLDASVECRK